MIKIFSVKTIVLGMGLFCLISVTSVLSSDHTQVVEQFKQQENEVISIAFINQTIGNYDVEICTSSDGSPVANAKGPINYLSARRFDLLIPKKESNLNISFSVLGFGSGTFSDFKEPIKKFIIRFMNKEKNNFFVLPYEKEFPLEVLIGSVGDTDGAVAKSSPLPNNNILMTITSKSLSESTEDFEIPPHNPTECTVLIIGEVYIAGGDLQGKDDQDRKGYGLSRFAFPR